jgi:hypothetical protein
MGTTKLEYMLTLADFSSLSAREKQFVRNFLGTSGSQSFEVNQANFLQDLALYRYPHSDVLQTFFDDYNFKEYKIPENLESKLCDDENHKWVTEEIDWDDMAKTVVCKKCGDSRYVEIDSELGGRLI